MCTVAQVRSRDGREDSFRYPYVHSGKKVSLHYLVVPTKQLYPIDIAFFFITANADRAVLIRENVLSMPFRVHPTLHHSSGRAIPHGDVLTLKSVTNVEFVVNRET